MSEPLNLNRLTIVPTVRCTLRCEMCASSIPMFKNAEHIPVAELIRDVDRIFELIDYTESLQFIGGEIFMRNDLSELYEHSLIYKNRFDKLKLATNATILPCKNDICVFKKYGENIKIRISNYGKYSPKIDEMAMLFESNGIPFAIKQYYLKNVQQGEGWIDNMCFEDRNRSEMALKHQFEHCKQATRLSFHMYKGKIHGCARSLMASTLGKIIPASRDFVDIYDTKETDVEKREKIRHFNDFPRVSCRSCVSYTDDVELFTAAEQI